MVYQSNSQYYAFFDTLLTLISTRFVDHPKGLKNASAWIESTDFTSFSLTVVVLAIKKLVDNDKPHPTLKCFKAAFLLKRFETVLLHFYADQNT